MHTSIGGPALRIRVSNEHGSVPLRVGAARVALRMAGADIVRGSDRALTFSGFGAITIPPGALVLSDPVALEVAALSDLAVSLYFPGEVQASTIHANTTQTSYVTPTGNYSASIGLPVQRIIFSWPFLTEVDVQSSGSALVALGDAITEGGATTRDANHRWPDFLAMRLQAMHDPLAQRSGRRMVGNRQIGIVNRAIGASRQDGAPAIAALARFDRDVLAMAGARQLIVLLGQNELGLAHEAALGIDALIAGYRQLIARAHAQGLTIYGGTMTPFEGGKRLAHAAPDREQLRQAAKQWIRSSGEFDAVIDFDRAVRDPGRPARMLPAFDSGDHVHPNDQGMHDGAASAHARFGGNDHRRGVNVGHHAGGQAVLAEPPFGFAAGIDQHRAAAGAVARFDIVQDAADHPRGLQVDVVLARRLDQHARHGLAAQAGNRIGGHLAVRVVRAIIKTIECQLFAKQQVGQAVLHRGQRRFRVAPVRHPVLVADHE